MIRINNKLLSFLLLFHLFLLSPLFSKDIAFWWWGSTLKQKKFNELLQLDINEIFIKAGYLRRDKNKYTFKKIKIYNKFSIKPGCKIHLVFAFLFNKNDSVKKDNFIKTLQKAIDDSIKYFSHNNIPIKGIQFDLEGKIAFKEYNYILENIKIDRTKYQISGAFYPSLISSSDYKKLLKHFDFISLMFYDHSYKFDNYILTDPDSINKFLEKTLKMSIKKYIGLPLYGVISVFNKNRTLVYPQIDLPNLDIFKTDHFQLLNIDKNVSTYKIIKAYKYKYLNLKKGWYVKIRKPDREELLNILSKINFNYPYIKGLCYFPYPIKKSFTLSKQDIIHIIQRSKEKMSE